MPLYEYKCPRCGTRFEILRGISSGNEPVACPKCGEDKPEKLLSAVCGGHNPDINRGNLRFPT